MAIPSFELFGEAETTGDMPDVLHCESIAARSRIYDWSFVAHRHHGLHQFFWVSRGGGRVSIDGEPQGFGPHTLLFIPRLCVHGFAFTPGTSGWVVTLPASMPLPVPETPQVLKVNGVSDPAGVTGLFAAIAEEHSHERPGRAEALQAHAMLLSVWVMRAMEARETPPDSPRRKLMRRFGALLEENYRQHWQVDRYAETLAVTPTHLTRTCREVTGKAASALIQERVLLEARRQLAYTDMRVSEIAQDLGYQDPAYFTRIFTNKVGRTPTAFREAPGAGAPDLGEATP
ncbi:helix-turn-helix domain-containing protein [Oceanicella sp. SM1341]|uniref:helix-turn-helix domain-containing protein n=1 Tax=Oceanicella sp. SM1341 TaxID=1548889 RepID=UPI001300801B|nr:helix-turn-helix domain-containing protein [Oceanicella sp. SM1341]